MPKTVSFVTLGCKVNQYDSQAMLEAFLEKGYRLSEDPGSADVVVVNTCTVTGTGDQKSRQMIHRYGRGREDRALVIAGCLAQRMGDRLLDTGARLIIGNQYRGRAAELLEEAVAEDKQIVAVDGVKNIPFERLSIHSHEGFTRAIMKIQEGCDNHCTYCIIPSVRGGIRSREAEDIRREAEALVQAGFSELVLTGIHLTSYGRDLPGKPNLSDAVRWVSEIPGVRRIRLGSLEPIIATDAFADALVQLPNFCPQFHLALQSGSDTVLCRMKRCYNTAQFSAAVERLRRRWPNAALTTDVIVGFPGESEEEFEQTLAFCQKIGFARLHVFPFSPREGTPAATMGGQLSRAAKSERVQRLITLGNALTARYQERFIGQTAEVLFEEKQEDGSIGGYTPEYIHVSAKNAEPGKIQKILLTASHPEGMTGELVETLG